VGNGQAEEKTVLSSLKGLLHAMNIVLKVLKSRSVPYILDES
jgi:hypothetical protein